MERSTLVALFLAVTLFVNTSPVRAQTAAHMAPVASSTNSTTLAARRDAERITAEKLRKDLFYVSSDEMAGRDTPSPGLDMTAEFIARRMRELNFKPAGDAGTYFQRIPLSGYLLDAAQTRARIGAEEFRFGDDFGATLVAGKARGNLVYVGHGWVVKNKNIDAYRGIDVRDKVIVVSGMGLPVGVTRADTPNQAQGTTWDSPESYARRHGARGIVRVTRAGERERAMRRSRAATVPGFYTLDPAPADPQPGIPVIFPSERMLAAILANEQTNAAAVTPANGKADFPAAFNFAANKTIEFTVAAKREPVKTQNVVAVLEGSDAVLKNEYVAIGAHYDHVGVREPVNGDAIYNGADDDGSGTVAMLAMAEAFAKGVRPKRSLLFVWHAGEEKGLWGSEYFADNPTVPVGQIVAQLNIDMIGRSRAADDTKPANKNLSGANEIYVIGSRMMSTELGALSERVNRDYLNLTFNYKYDDPNDPNRFFFRSDHFNYAAKGIPVIFYFSGVHEDYHRPSDTADKIDYGKMERVARTIFLTASELANAARRPTVDRQLPAQLTNR